MRSAYVTGALIVAAALVLVLGLAPTAYVDAAMSAASHLGPEAAK